MTIDQSILARPSRRGRSVLPVWLDNDQAKETATEHSRTRPAEHQRRSKRCSANDVVQPGWTRLNEPEHPEHHDVPTKHWRSCPHKPATFFSLNNPIRPAKPVQPGWTNLNEPEHPEHHDVPTKHWRSWPSSPITFFFLNTLSGPDRRCSDRAVNSGCGVP